MRHPCTLPLRPPIVVDKRELLRAPGEPDAPPPRRSARIALPDDGRCVANAEERIGEDDETDAVGPAIADERRFVGREKRLIGALENDPIRHVAEVVDDDAMTADDIDGMS